jgi:hypothetical protein
MEGVNKMPATPQLPGPIDEICEKEKWRRDVASKCLVAAYGSDIIWESPAHMVDEILESIDSLDRALDGRTQ